MKAFGKVGRLCCVIALNSLVLCGCPSVERQWEHAQATNSVEAYERFLADYPNSIYVEAATQGIRVLKYGDASAIDTAGSYEVFIKEYPEGDLADRARARTEELRFLEAAAIRSHSAYQEFLQQYPNGAYAEKARTGVRELWEQDLNRARQARTEEALNTYLESQPPEDLANSARQQLLMLKAVAIRGKLFGIYAPADGRLRHYLQVDKKYYDLHFSAASQFVGDTGGAFSLGHVYEVVGTVGPKTFLIDAVGTIDVFRTTYIGEK